MTDEGSIEVETTWHSHIQTTDPPRLTPHDVWTLEIQLHGAAPLRIASVIHADAMFSWALVEANPDPNDKRVEAQTAIRPWGWTAGEDRVEIRVGFLRANFADRAMLDDPRGQVEVITPTAVASGSFSRSF